MALVAGMLSAAMMGAAPQQAAAAGESPRDREFGEYLSRECVTCHQITGRVVGHVPMIIAWPEDQFIAVMQSYRSKHRENKVMQAVASKLSDNEIEALAAYFGALPPQPKIN
jgi:cytochrome c553